MIDIILIYTKGLLKSNCLINSFLNKCVKIGPTLHRKIKFIVEFEQLNNI